MRKEKKEFIPFDMSAIGKCSLCSGTVAVPTIWHGTIPPNGQCLTCGAIEIKSELPTIKTKKV